MPRFLDRIATQHRNWEARITALVVLVILAWATFQLRSVKLLEVTSDDATVVEVVRLGGESTLYKGTLVLSDSTTLDMLLPNPVPNVGDVVPLRVEHLSNHKKSYSVDLMKWRTGVSE